VEELKETHALALASMNGALSAAVQKISEMVEVYLLTHSLTHSLYLSLSPHELLPSQDHKEERSSLVRSALTAIDSVRKHVQKTVDLNEPKAEKQALPKHKRLEVRTKPTPASSTHPGP
jgi:hypothetical protein